MDEEQAHSTATPYWATFNDAEAEKRLGQHLPRIHQWEPPPPNLAPPRTVRPSNPRHLRNQRAARSVANRDSCTVLPALAGCPTQLLLPSTPQREMPDAPVYSHRDSVRLPVLESHLKPSEEVRRLHLGLTPGQFQQTPRRSEAFDMELEALGLLKRDQSKDSGEQSEPNASPSPQGSPTNASPRLTFNEQLEESINPSSYGRSISDTDADSPMRRSYSIFARAKGNRRSEHVHLERKRKLLVRRPDRPERPQDNAESVVAQIIHAPPRSQAIMQEALASAHRGSHWGSILKPVPTTGFLVKISRARLEACEYLRAMITDQGPTDAHRNEIERRNALKDGRGSRDFVRKLWELWNQMAPHGESEISIIALMHYMTSVKKKGVAKKVMGALLENGRKTSCRVEDMMRIIWPHASETDVQVMSEWMEEFDLEAHQPKALPVMPEDTREELTALFRYYDTDQGGLLTRAQCVEAGFLDDGCGSTEAEEAVFGRDGMSKCDLRQFLELMCPPGYRAYAADQAKDVRVTEEPGSKYGSKSGYDAGSPGLALDVE